MLFCSVPKDYFSNEADMMGTRNIAKILFQKSKNGILKVNR